MSDGPFKNLRLGSRWKRFAEAVQNDAVAQASRCALASDALVREILTDGTRTLLADLHAYCDRQQLDLDPLASVERIFDDHSKTSFTDTLHRELAFRVNEQLPPPIAIGQALEAAVGQQIREAKSRIEEECIRACESREMMPEQLDRTVTQANAALDDLAQDEICNALRADNKNAFKDAVLKKEGLDEGPDL